MHSADHHPALPECHLLQLVPVSGHFDLNRLQSVSHKMMTMPWQAQHGHQCGCPSLLMQCHVSAASVLLAHPIAVACRHDGSWLSSCTMRTWCRPLGCATAQSTSCSSSWQAARLCPRLSQLRCTHSTKTRSWSASARRRSAPAKLCGAHGGFRFT